MGNRPLGNATHCHVDNLVCDSIPGTHQAKRENLRKGIQPFRGTPAVNYCVGSCSWSNMASD
jgi:hypothetical protein